MDSVIYPSNHRIQKNIFVSSRLVSIFEYNGCFSVSLQKNVDFNNKKDPNKALRIAFSTKVCSEQFQDNDVKFVDSRTRKIERWRLSFIVFMIRRKVFRKEIVLCFLQVIVGMVVAGQEKPGINELLQGQGKVREFHFESGKNYVFERTDSLEVKFT